MCIKNFDNKKTIIKNLLAFILSFLLISCTLSSVTNIQSVLNKDDGLGLASQITMFCTNLLFCLVLPQLLVEFLGYKWSTVIAEFGILIYVGAMAYPKWSTLLPSRIYLIYNILT